MSGDLGPPGRERPGPTPETGPNQKLVDTTTNQLKPNVVGRQWYLRRAASPWHYPPPGERGYEDAALHLLGHGLTPAPNGAGLEAMRRRGHSRQAEFIEQAWELAG